MSTKKPHKDIFQKNYFTDYYFGTTGNFTQKELQRNKNWLYGWFQALQKDFDFTNGKGKKILEIGCAIGAAADILYERGFDVITTDISPYAIKKNKKLLPHIKCEVMDIEEKQKYKNEFDVIFSFEVIEHLPHPEKAFKNMYDMLKPGGILINSSPYPYDYVLYADKTHVNVRYPSEWIDLLRKSGFYIIKYRVKSFIPFFYRISKYFHLILPFGTPDPYINSTIFYIAQKPL